MSAKLAVLALLPLAIAGLLMTNHCLVVNVQEGGPDGTRITVPVPLFLAQAVLTVAPMPADVRDLQLPPEAERYLPVARRLVGELDGIPDALLVSVEERDERVEIRKSGHVLIVDVRDGRDEEVHVRVPIDSVSDLLARLEDGSFHPKHLVSALRWAPRGDLVHVRDARDEVRITIW